MYGSLHFIVTIWVAVWLFRSYSDDYPRYRNTLAITTVLALIGFTFFPLMPPRLLATDPYFAHHFRAAPRLRRHARQVPDALVVRLRAGMKSISNQYAAMPSVHIAWSTWCALALVPRLKTRGRKILAALLSRSSRSS